MKLIIDENIKGIGKYLEEWGWEIISFEEGIDDSQLIKIAKENLAGIVTRDIRLEQKCERENVPCYRVRNSALNQALHVHRALKHIRQWVIFGSAKKE